MGRQRGGAAGAAGRPGSGEAGGRATVGKRLGDRGLEGRVWAAVMWEAGGRFGGQGRASRGGGRGGAVRGDGGADEAGDTWRAR